MASLISHVEFNVIDYDRSIAFYDSIFPFMGLNKINSTDQYTAYTDGESKIIICPTEEAFKKNGYHRKNPGLNHLAFYASSREKVDEFYEEVLQKNGIASLYSEGARGDSEYYAVFFEDPDRLKVEFVFAPNYCDPKSWPNNLPDNK